MPHIIVEYSKNLESQISIGDMLIDLHDGLASLGVDKARIKTRGISLDHAVVSDMGADGAMVHATLLILDGRTLDEKKAMGDKLHHIMSESVLKIIDHCAVTLEIRDMDRETYYL